MSAAGGRLSIGRQLAWGMLLLLIATVPTYFLVSAVQNGLAMLRALHTLDADEAGRGAGTVVHGTLVSPPTYPTMISSERGVWVGELGGTEDSGKSAHHVVYCVFRSVDGATVRDASGTIVTLRDFDTMGVWGTVLPIDGPRVATIDMSADHTQSITPTAEIMKACPRTSRSAYALYYREQYATPGTELMMRGCMAPGSKVLRPCGDGLDFVSDRPIDTMRRDLKEGHEWGVASGAIPVAILCGFLMLLARNKRVIDSRPEGSR